MIHTSASTGFGNAADAYAVGRPGYPDKLHGWVHKQLGLGSGKAVVDLGAGTGKFIPFLRASGAQVTAVEPVAAMRKVLVQNYPDIEALDGTAKAIPLPDCSADVVVSAQAFHWFASDAALTEIYRVLKPDGRLGLIWNVRDENVPWVAALNRIMAPFEVGTPRFHTGDWRKVFPSTLFSNPAEMQFQHEHHGPAGAVIVDRVLSVSFIAALPNDEKTKVRRKISKLIATTPELAGHETITFPYVTSAFVSVKY